MKKKHKQQQHQQHGSSAQDDQEIIKAVAQAWYAKSSSSKSMASEFDTHRRNFKGKPSRFKLEAMKKAASSSTSEENGRSSTSSWDFGESLWDSYEIVAISKRLERGLVLDHFLSSEVEAAGQHVFKKRKESKNSLRNILNKMSSRRFDEPNFAPNDWY